MNLSCANLIDFFSGFHFIIYPMIDEFVRFILLFEKIAKIALTVSLQKGYNNRQAYI